MSRDKNMFFIYNTNMEKSPFRVGFMASHNGTDFQAIVQNIEEGNLNITPAALITNNSKSEARKFAIEHKVPDYHVSTKTHEDPDSAIVSILLKNGVELVIFSGYMKILDKDSPLLKTYKEKIWNPHPADPKKYPGLWGDAVHEAVLKAGDEFTFPTIHLVDEGTDTGEILKQGKVPVLPNDTVDKLRSRVQKKEISLILSLLHEYVD